MMVPVWGVVIVEINDWGGWTRESEVITRLRKTATGLREVWFIVR